MKKLKDLTLKEKIGQLLIVGIQGPTLNEDEINLIKEYKIGNFILFVRNIDTIDGLAKLTSSIHELCNKELGIMPFIAIDQEGGMVSRIMDTHALVPGQMTISAAKAKGAKEIGKIMADSLLSLGINLNFAPSVDVNCNPNNPIIGVRSYGDDPKIVASIAKEVISGMQENGLIACAKHFPGHGDVEVDSHLGLPVLNFSKERLEQRELYPFKEVIESGVKSIMSAHIVFNEYDKTSPATVSSAIITKLLRQKLHFKGLIISDCMEMKAIDDLYTAPVGAARGLIAGLDMACICHTLEKHKQAVEVISKAVSDGLLTEEEIDKKIERILKAKKESLTYIKKKFYEVKDHKEELEKIDNSISQEVVDLSLTKVSGDDYALNGKCLVLYTEPIAQTIAEDEIELSNLGELIKHENSDIDVIKYVTDAYDNDLINKTLGYDTVVFVSYNAFNNPSQAKMINELNHKHPNFYIIANRNPYDYFIIEGKANFYSLYEATTLSNNTIVKFVLGKISAHGLSPVKVGMRFNPSASIYIDHEEYKYNDTVEYLKMLKSCGIDTVFISASHVDEREEYLENLKKILKVAKTTGIKLVMDINKPLLKKVSVPLDSYALRLDYGFSANDIKDFLDNGYNIELNGSTMTKELLDELVGLGVNLRGMRISHNFYPKPYTGLSQEKVLEMNKLFKQYGLRILAFIPSSSMKRGPVHEGLPTIEDHRYLNIYACLTELAMLGVDDVCFGDAYVSREEIEILKNFDKEKAIIPIALNYKISEKLEAWITKPHTVRIDESIYFKRTDDRFNEPVVPKNQAKRLKFSVTIDNSNFSVYNGELCIMKTDLDSDQRVNVLAKALISDWLLNNLVPGSMFEIKIIEG